MGITPSKTLKARGIIEIITSENVSPQSSLWTELFALSYERPEPLLGVDDCTEEDAAGAEDKRKRKEDEDAMELYDDDSVISTAEVFALMSPPVMRRMRDELRENWNLCLDEALETLPRTTSCKILTRMLPFVFEGGDAATYETLYRDDEAREEDGEEEEEANNNNDNKKQPRTQQHPMGSRARRMVLKSFTYLIGAVKRFDTEPISNATKSRQVNRLRIQENIMRMLLVALSEPLYNAGANLGRIREVFLEVFATLVAQDEAGMRRVFSYLLIDVVASSHDTNTERNSLADATTAFLAALFDACYPSATITTATTTTNNNHALNSLESLISHTLFLHPPSTTTNPTSPSATFFYESIAKLLQKEIDNRTTTFALTRPPGVPYFRELLVLLFRVLENHSTAFRAVAAASPLSHRMMMPALLHFMWTSRRAKSAPNDAGAMQIATFILLALSSSRDFCVDLNARLAATSSSPHEPGMRVVEATLPGCGVLLPAKEATFLDLLVVGLTRLLADSDAMFQPLHRAWLTVLLNVSPYAKRLASESAMRLMSALERYSRPSFLFRGSDNNQYLFFLLEIVRNVLQYQSSGNPHLIYAVVRERAVFRRIRALKLPAAEKEEENETDPKRQEGESSVTRPVSRPPRDFYPTEHWFNSWKSRLPMEVIERAIEVVVPKLARYIREEEELVEGEAPETTTTTNGSEGSPVDTSFSSSSSSSSAFGIALTPEEVVGVIENSITLVGALPSPPPILVSHYQKSLKTELAIRVYLWSVIFTRIGRSMPAWDAEKLTLLGMRFPPNSTSA